MVDGRRGNPVLFDRATFADLMQLTGDAGGRQVFSKHLVTWVPWVEPSAGMDVDTPEDYARLLKYED
jgi:molybdenum cofactor cytidylyltransferase